MEYGMSRDYVNIYESSNRKYYLYQIVSNLGGEIIPNKKSLTRQRTLPRQAL